MLITFSCGCGEKLAVPASCSGRKAFCLKCRRSVPIPISAAGVQAPQLAAASAATPASAGHGSTGKASGGNYSTIAAPVVAPPLDDELALAPMIELPRPDEKLDEGATISMDVPLHFEWVLGKGGKEHWKITCTCGKRLLSPAPSTHPFGRCPKCGRNLPLPGYETREVLRVPPKAAGGAPGPSTGDAAAHSEAQLKKPPSDERIRVVAAKVFGAEQHTNHDAAVTAADRLRPQHSERLSSARRTASGRISAWPLAGVGRRLLATFIDLALATAAGGVVMVMTMLGYLPAGLQPYDMLVATLLLTALFNDGIIHLIWGGSAGKKLVRIVVRDADGARFGPVRILVRALLKWLLVPGWIVGAFEPTERTFHDLVCGTLVLKGRASRR